MNRLDSPSSSPPRSSAARGRSWFPWPLRTGMIGLALTAAVSPGSERLAQAQDPRSSVSLTRPPQSSSERNAEARAWFQDAKLGLFVHWGVYSLLGKGERVMERDHLPVAEYSRLSSRFNPTRFDPDAWVKLARGAGARYLTVTAKGPDGFCLFDSNLTDFDVVDATPFHADPLRALADACRQQGIRLFFHYSLLDWHHPDGSPAGRLGGRDRKQYIAYYQGQIRELCTNYGEIGGLWLDGCPDGPGADLDLAATYRMIHELQPGALVGNSRRGAPIPGEDFRALDPEPPGQSAAADDLPREILLTVNDSRGYNAADVHYKSPEALIRAVVGAAGRGANIQLSVGPLPDGTIGSEPTRRLLELGKWLSASGATIYGTRRGPIAPRAWGVSTAKGPKDRPSEVFLHVLDPDAESPIVLGDAAASLSPFLFSKEVPLRLTKAPGGLALDLPRDIRSPVDTIVALRPQVLK